MKFISSAFAFSLLITSSASSGEFTYSDLVSLIKAESITSLEALLPRLPEALRSNYTLMHTSQSLQGASYEYPRVILFGKDGSLTCTFNGAPEQAAFDTLECFQFLKAEKKFDFRQIEFPSERNHLSAVIFSATNRSADGRVSCAGCHRGPDSRPNWSEYNTWPGAYGSSADLINRVEAEKEKYPVFVSKRASHPRYKWLIQDSAPLAPFERNATNEGGLPNFRFGELVGRMNGLRAGRILQEKTPRWKSLAFAYSGLKCSLTEDQARRIQEAQLPLAADTDLSKIFKGLGVSALSWSTRITADPNRGAGRQGLDYDQIFGLNNFSEIVGMSVLVDRANEGDLALREGIARTIDFQPIPSTTHTPRLVSVLNSILPVFSYYDYRTSPQRNLCPRVGELFTEEYLKHQD